MQTPIITDLFLMHHDSSKEEVIRNVTETSVVSDYYKATLATFDEKSASPCLESHGRPHFVS